MKKILSIMIGLCVAVLSVVAQTVPETSQGFNMGSATENNISVVVGQPFGGIFIPNEIDPYNLAAGEIGETYILPFVFAHVFVDDRTIAFLVDMVAVDVGDTFLDETFGFGNVFFGWSVATVLVFDGEVDIPSFVEGIAMVVATVDFFIVPSFDGDDIILSVGHAKDCHDHS